MEVEEGGPRVTLCISVCMLQFKYRFDRKTPVCGGKQARTGRNGREEHVKCSPGPPCSATVQVRPECNMIYTKKPDSQRLHCFTQCPLSVSGAIYASLQASWVTWINIWQGGTQVTSKLLLQQTYHISALECSTAAETLSAAFIKRPRLIAFVWHERESAVNALITVSTPLCVLTLQD